MTLKVMRDEGGVRALYRGLVATAMGVAPYVGINFAAYEALRGLITPPGKTNIARKLSCGALAGKRYPCIVFELAFSAEFIWPQKDQYRKRLHIRLMSFGGKCRSLAWVQGHWDTSTTEH
jgi:hypothetical protein